MTKEKTERSNGVSFSVSSLSQIEHQIEELSHEKCKLEGEVNDLRKFLMKRNEIQRERHHEIMRMKNLLIDL